MIVKGVAQDMQEEGEIVSFVKTSVSNNSYISLLLGFLAEHHLVDVSSRGQTVFSGCQPSIYSLTDAGEEAIGDNLRAISDEMFANRPRNIVQKSG